MAAVFVIGAFWIGLVSCAVIGAFLIGVYLGTRKEDRTKNTTTS
jgi:hypothetical protein